MTIASRTPEGLPARCPLCDAVTNLDFSEPGGDAPCPNCGCLLWKSADLLGRVQSMVGVMLSIPAGEINADTAFLDELRADSLDVVELAMEFEDEFGVTISDKDFEAMNTVGDFVRYVEREQQDDDERH